jgi:hypothetical protein
METLKKKKMNYYTEDDDRILLQCFEEYPTVTAGSRAAADLLNRTEGAIMQRWYVLKKKKSEPKPILKTTYSNDWMPREIEMLVKHARTHPGNITEGINEFATKTNRRPMECMEKFYSLTPVTRGSKESIKKISFVNLDTLEINELKLFKQDEDKITFSMGDGFLVIKY